MGVSPANLRHAAAVRYSLTPPTRRGDNAGWTPLWRSTRTGASCYGQRRYQSVEEGDWLRAQPPWRRRDNGPARCLYPFPDERRDGGRDPGPGSVGVSPAKLRPAAHSAASRLAAPENAKSRSAHSLARRRVARLGWYGRRGHGVLGELVGVKVGRIAVVNPLGGEVIDMARKRPGGRKAKAKARPEDAKCEGEASPAEAGSSSATVGLHEWRGHTRKGIAWQVHRGDACEVLKTLKATSHHCAVTSPPYYWQRDYEADGQIGKEKTIDEYVRAVCDAMDEVRRVLRDDGLLFLNLGDTYYSAKGQPKGVDRKNRARRFGLRAVDASGLGVSRKTIIGIPWRVAIEMIDRGWTLRSPIVWRREGSIPEPTAKDRPWRTYEMVFMFSKSPRYFFERDGLVPGEDIWTISDRPKNTNGLHVAPYPDTFVNRCLRVGCPTDGVVLDPFAGSGTTLRVAVKSGRGATGIDISQRFCEYMAHELDAL